MRRACTPSWWWLIGGWIHRDKFSFALIYSYIYIYIMMYSIYILPVPSMLFPIAFLASIPSSYFSPRPVLLSFRMISSLPPPSCPLNSSLSFYLRIIRCHLLNLPAFGDISFLPPSLSSTRPLEVWCPCTEEEEEGKEGAKRGREGREGGKEDGREGEEVSRAAESDAPAPSLPCRRESDAWSCQDVGRAGGWVGGREGGAGSSR